ncbi:MAG: hypothetical protein ACR2QB_03665 [Gammaproteobacteria bacterium]
MLIELIGPSGIGKTTILRGLAATPVGQRADFLSYEDYIARRRIEAGDKHGEEPSILPLFWQHPRFAMAVMTLAFMHGPPVKRRFRKALRCLASLAIAQELRSRYPDKLIVIDNGFTQTLWSLVVESRVLRGQNQIAAAMACYYELVHQQGIRLLVDDEQIKTRVFARESSGRFNRDAGKTEREAYGKWLDFFREIVSRAPKGMIVAEVDGQQSPENVAAAIAHTIDSLDISA